MISLVSVILKCESDGPDSVNICKATAILSPSRAFMTTRNVDLSSCTESTRIDIMLIFCRTCGQNWLRSSPAGCAYQYETEERWNWKTAYNATHLRTRFENEATLPIPAIQKPLQAADVALNWADSIWPSTIRLCSMKYLVLSGSHLRTAAKDNQIHC